MTFCRSCSGAAFFCLKAGNFFSFAVKLLKNLSKKINPDFSAAGVKIALPLGDTKF